MTSRRVPPESAMSDASGTVEVAGRLLTLSNRDKALFPCGVTKGEMIDHYARWAPQILASIQGRALTLRRFPNGIEQEGWFQKHAPTHLPSWVSLATIPGSVGSAGGRGAVEHIVADGPAVLVYLANLATIELHTGPALAASPDQAEELVLDLDPPVGVDARAVRRATRRTLALLDELGMPARIKTSGSKGFHVHVPMRDCDQDLARNLARSLATVLAGRHPDELTVEHRIERRGGRVFVDWLRNSPRQTFVAPYSVRARAGAPVATPMDRSELDGTAPQRWTIRSLRRRSGRREGAWPADPPRTDPRGIVPALTAALAELA